MGRAGSPRRGDDIERLHGEKIFDLVHRASLTTKLTNEIEDFWRQNERFFSFVFTLLLVV